MTTVRNSEIIPQNFHVVWICTCGICAHKGITILYSRSYWFTVFVSLTT